MCAIFSLYSTLRLYDGDIGSSPSLELTTMDSSLSDDDWDDRASSAVVSGGCQWVLYDTNFEALGLSSSSSVGCIHSFLDYQTMYSLLYTVY